MSRQDCAAAMADLRAELAAALGRSTRELTAQRTAAMTAAERGRWTRQVLALMKVLDKSAGEPKEPPKSPPSSSASAARRKRSSETSRQLAIAIANDEIAPVEQPTPISPATETPRLQMRSLCVSDQDRLTSELHILKDRTTVDPFARRSRTPIRRDEAMVERLMTAS